MYEEIAKGLFAIYSSTYGSNVVLSRGKTSVLFDVGCCDPGGFLKDLKELGVGADDIRHIYFTHGHFDHIGHCHLFKKAKMSMADPDATHLNNKDSKFADSVFFTEVPHFPKITSKLKHNQKIEANGYTWTVMSTPGHTAGHVIFWEKQNRILIAGDLIFPGGGVGRWDLPTGNEKELWESVRKAQQLKFRVMVSGHGAAVLANR